MEVVQQGRFVLHQFVAAGAVDCCWVTLDAGAGASAGRQVWVRVDAGGGSRSVCMAVDMVVVCFPVALLCALGQATQ